MRKHSRLKTPLTLCGIALGLFLILYYSRELSQGIREGIAMAVNLVIPSMFLFLIASNLIIGSRELFALPFRGLAGLFRIPPEEMAIVVLSLTGGYPVGAKLLGDGVREGRLSTAEAERMLPYCVNCGPAFLISGVGIGLFGNPWLGVCLYLSQIAACLGVGYLCSFHLEEGRLRRYPRLRTHVRPAGSSSVGIVAAVSDAVRSMGMICGFVVAFSGLLPVLKRFLGGLAPEAVCWIQGLLEVTSGCGQLPASQAEDPLLLAAVFTAFGGVCVHLQICAMAKPAGIPMGRFLAFRPVYTLISVIVSGLLFRLVPGTADCIAWSREIPSRIVSVSPAASFFLILLGIMLLFFNGKSDKIEKIRQSGQIHGRGSSENPVVRQAD